MDGSAKRPSSNYLDLFEVYIHSTCIKSIAKKLNTLNTEVHLSVYKLVYQNKIVLE